MIYLWRSLKLLWPHRGMVALYALVTFLLGAVTSLPLVLGRAVLGLLGGSTAVPTTGLQPRATKILDQLDRGLRDFLGGTDAQHYLYGLCIAIVVCVLLKAILDFLVTYLQGWISQRLQIEAMEKLMDHLLRLDCGFFDRSKLGDLTSRIGGDTGMLQMSAKLALECIEKPFLIFFLAYAAIVLDWKLFLLAAIGVPLVVGPLIQVTRRVYKHALRARERAADLAEDMLQDLSGIRTVQAYGAEEAEGHNFRGLAERFFGSCMARVRNRALQRPLAEVVMAFGVVLVVLYGSLQVLHGEEKLENFLAFVGALGMLYNPVRGFLSTLGELAEFVPGAERAFTLLDTRAGVAEAPHAVPCAPLQREIVFENVTLDYGRGPVFRNLNLRIRMGERVGIVGRTGVGKSSLLSLLLRFYDPAAGRITFDGQDLRAFTFASLRRQIALVSQEPFLFHTSVEENIRYGKPEATPAEVEAAARAAAIHDEIAALPEAYRTQVGERGVTFSGGQRQRIAVARAILRNAPVLLLDEATSALDSASEQRVQEALDRLAAGRTSLIVAHRLSTIRDAHQIVVFSDDGDIEAVAPHDELLRRSPTYRHLWERQSGGGKPSEGMRAEG